MGRLSRPFLVGALVLLGGCYRSHERVDAGAPLEGPRLRPVELVGEGGAAMPYGFFDRLLGVDCAFAPSSDGTLRCLPTDVEMVRYEDPECRRPVLRLGAADDDDAPCPYAPYARELGCDRRVSVYRPGATRVIDQVYSNFLGACQPDRFAAPSLVADVTLVEPSELAAATPEPIPPGSGVVREVLVTEEGARYPVGRLWDRDRGAACTLSADEAVGVGRASCVAEGDRSSLATFPGCVEPIAVSIGSCPSPAPGGVVLGREITCEGLEARAYEVGERLDATEATSCRLPEGAAAWRLTAVDAEDAPLDVRRVGSGRLRGLEYGSPGGDRFTHESFGLFWDEVRGRLCGPQLIGGELRCVPVIPHRGFSGGGRAPDFSDADCTIPALRWPDELACEVDEDYYFFWPRCPREGSTSVYTKGERSDRWYRLEGGRCRAVAGMPGETVRLLRETSLGSLERVVR